MVIPYDVVLRSGEQWYLKHYVWPRQGTVLILQGGTPANVRERYEPMMDAIAESREMTQRN